MKIMLIGGKHDFYFKPMTGIETLVIQIRGDSTIKSSQNQNIALNEGSATVFKSGKAVRISSTATSISLVLRQVPHSQASL